MYPGVKEILCVFLFVLCSYLYWCYYKFTKDFKGFPLQTIGLKILSQICFGMHSKDMTSSRVLLQALFKRSDVGHKEGLCAVWFLQPLLFVFGEEYTKVLLNDCSVLDRPIFYSLLTLLTGDGFLTQGGSTWRKRRKMLNPAFRPEVLRSDVCVLNNVARDVVRRLSESSSEPNPDVITILKNGTLKALCEAVFRIKKMGKNYDEQLEEVGDATDRLATLVICRFARPWMYFKKLLDLRFQQRRTLNQCHTILKNFTKYLVEEMLKSDSPSSSKSDTSGGVQCDEDVECRKIPSILAENHKKDPSFTIKDIEEEVQTLVFAGHDTSSFGMLWTLFMLALHPEVQDKAFAEIKSVIESTDADFTHSDLKELRYLESVIKETMRIYPVVPFFGRKVTKDVQCGRYRIPKDTCIVFCTYVLHRNSNIYPEPKKFDPDRFYESNLKHPWAYIPFAEGIRSCIGKNFAMMEMKIFLAHILLNFKVTTPDRREDVKLDWKVTLQPSKPIRLKFTHRQSELLEG